MSVIESARRIASDALAIRSLRRHRSRLGWRQAPRYTRYWHSCRDAFTRELPPVGTLADAVADFHRDGLAAFHTPETERIARQIFDRICARERNCEQVWITDPVRAGEYTGDVWRDFPELEGLFTGPLGTFLMHHFGCDYKIFFGKLYKSTHTEGGPTGSQIWHADGGPGSCINVMFYLHPTDTGSGPIEVLPWDASLAIFERERKALRSAPGGIPKGPKDRGLRDAYSNYYKRAIAEEYHARVRQPMGPAGLVVPFQNNNLHRGGYPAEGRDRYAAVFHCYPSDRPADFAHYRSKGVPKTASYPMDPAAVF